jgi:hypothetical protein
MDIPMHNICFASLSSRSLVHLMQRRIVGSKCRCDATYDLFPSNSSIVALVTDA